MVAIGAPSAPAQTGVVSGVILDHTNRTGLDGVIIRITGMDTVVATDRTGRFTLAGVGAGVRELEARRPGYATFKFPLVRVPANDTARVTFAMSLETASPIDVGWTTNAKQYRGLNGQSFAFRCPPGGSPQSVWGTDIYTDDSSVCAAAVHAGRITLAEGGIVTIEIYPGGSGFAGSMRNGITSAQFGAWEGAFVFR
jgi:hypothetical protein